MKFNKFDDSHQSQTGHPSQAWSKHFRFRSKQKSKLVALSEKVVCPNFSVRNCCPEIKTPNFELDKKRDRSEPKGRRYRTD